MIRNAVTAVCLLTLLVPMRVMAQDDSPYTERGPRFFTASSTPVRIDVAKTPALRRRISVDLHDISLAAALDTIARKGDLHIMYSRTVLPLNRRVRLKADDITVAAALTEVLLDTDADILFARSGQAAVVKRVTPLSRAAVVPVGSIVGRVTDGRTGAGVPSAQLVVEQTRIATTADDSGRFRMTDVPAGTLRVTARRIGYQPRSVSVTVGDNSETTVNITLDLATTMLNEVVVTGSIAPTEVKALPTPVTVVNAQTIEQQHVSRFDEIIRLAVPGAVVWDQGATSSTVMEISVRGTSGLGSVAAKAPKVYVDGVEVSVRHLAPVDPESIDHIEMIRGPQAAAIYGSDAIGGVIQIFTKRGAARLDRPEVNARVSVSRIQSQFKGSGAGQEDYAADLQGNTGGASYRLGGSYSHTGDWIPEYNMAQPSVNGGARIDQGPFTIDLSSRVFWQQGGLPFDTRFAATGALPTSFAYPNYIHNDTREETYSTRMAYRPRSWWQHSVTLGADRWASTLTQTRPRRSTPADTLLRVSVQNIQKVSVAYNTTITAMLAPGIGANLTAGADHYAYSNDYFNTTGAVKTTPLQLAAGQTITGLRDRAMNTGVYGQAQVSVHDELFLTGGLRGEANSYFGSDVGMQVSPRVGATYVRDVGPATVKLRGSYGQAIRPPVANQKTGSVTANSILLPNPDLRPERETGPDGGVDLVFGGRGSFSVTYYDQVAKDLIQAVLVDATTTPKTSQYQNIAKVKSTGWEFEGTLAFTRASLRGQYAISNSRPEDLGSYQGTDYHVGQQFPDLPRYTGGLMLTARPIRQTSVTAGVAYTGSWKSIDYLAYYSCIGKTAPCKKTPASTADYLRTYPAFTTVNVSVEQPIASGLSGFIAIDDATNDGNRRAHTSFVPVHGRMTTVGVRLHY